MKVNMIYSMDMEDLRAFCVKYKLYTKGSNRDYEKVLNQAQYDVSLDEIASIATDIYFHSDPEVELFRNADGAEEAVECILWYLYYTNTVSTITKLK